jgi:nicotinate phosphoribosyltransferase
MMQAVFHQFPGTMVEYQFKLRNKGVDLTPYKKEIENEIKELCKLSFTDDELEYLSSLRFMKPDFIELLRIFKLDNRFVKVDEFEDVLTIKIAGPWLHTILFEVPILAIVNEVYFRNKTSSYASQQHALTEGRIRLGEKTNKLIGYIRAGAANSESLSILISDFGTRRRFSAGWHDEVIARLTTNLPETFIGTSNVMLAKRYKITPIGTMAHEWLQAPQGFDGVQLAASQRYALQKWSEEYRGDLGIALSDVVGFEAFLRDFDLYFMKLFDGCRHDSGDPVKWAERLIKHYKDHKIDPMTKRAVFSDGLTVDKAIELHWMFRNAIQLGFGIGTHLTNDVGLEPLQIVIKLTKVNGKPVAKVSDSRGKTMCEDQAFLEYLMKVFEIK